MKIVEQLASDFREQIADESRNMTRNLAAIKHHQQIVSARLAAGGRPDAIDIYWLNTNTREAAEAYRRMLDAEQMLTLLQEPDMSEPDLFELESVKQLPYGVEITLRRTKGTS